MRPYPQRTPAASVAPLGVAAAQAELSDLIRRYPALTALRGNIWSAYQLLVSVFDGDGKVLVAGNGGSSADAAHIVGELMKGMVRRRPLGPEGLAALQAVDARELREYLATHLEGALPAVDLGSHSALLSAIANDTSANMGMAQQVYGLGRAGDLLWVLSTSGRSRNVLLAAATARAVGLRVLAMTGPSGSELASLADVVVGVPGRSVQEIQELHLPVYHALCAMLESTFFSFSQSDADVTTA